MRISRLNRRSFARFLPMAALLAVMTMAAFTAQAAPSDFTVTSPLDGKTFKLSEAKGKYVALHFLLKTECPFCLRHTRDYATRSASMPGVVHVFLKPDSADEIKSWTEKTAAGDVKSPVTVYQDVDAKLAEGFAIPGGYEFHGQTVHYPALVLLDPNGKEVFRYVGKSNSDRYSYDQFVAKMTELSPKASANISQYNLGADKVAIKGYDPVAYFTVGAPVKGDKSINSQYEGVTYYFGSPENRKLFTQAPTKYLPTYGGWCATAMAKGEKVEIDPTNFKVTNGRLFLFFKAFYANAIKDWNKDEPNSIVKADTNWKKISGE